MRYVTRTIKETIAVVKVYNGTDVVTVHEKFADVKEDRIPKLAKKRVEEIDGYTYLGIEGITTEEVKYKMGINTFMELATVVE